MRPCQRYEGWPWIIVALWRRGGCQVAQDQTVQHQWILCWRQRRKRPIAIWLYVPWLKDSEGWYCGCVGPGRAISAISLDAAKGLFWRLLSGLIFSRKRSISCHEFVWFPSTLVLKSTAPLWPFLGIASSWSPGRRSGRKCVTMGQVLTCALLWRPTKTTEEKPSLHQSPIHDLH